MYLHANAKRGLTVGRDPAEIGSTVTAVVSSSAARPLVPRAATLASS
jgi:hypothetical protein